MNLHLKQESPNVGTLLNGVLTPKLLNTPFSFINNPFLILASKIV